MHLRTLYHELEIFCYSVRYRDNDKFIRPEIHNFFGQHHVPRGFSLVDY
jgi:hypothetical protein